MVEPMDIRLETGLTYGVLTIRTDTDATINVLKKALLEKGGRIEENQMRFAYSGQELDLNSPKKLVDYGIKDRSTVHLIVRVRGGKDPFANLGQRCRRPKRKITPLPPHIEITTTDLCVVLSVGDAEEPNAIMPCGHAISSEGMIGTCRALLQEGKYQFRCPFVFDDNSRCDREWPWYMVRHVAVDLNDEEIEWFETEINKHQLRTTKGIQQCPKCNVFCLRDDTLNNRVVCPMCTLKDGRDYEFCWVCIYPWGSGSKCANCTVKLETLKTATLKTVVNVPNVPSIRACPNCFVLINFDQGCKHMTCVACGYEFCFICLVKWNKGRSGWFSPCTPASIQTKLQT